MEAWRYGAHHDVYFGTSNPTPLHTQRSIEAGLLTDVTGRILYEADYVDLLPAD